MRGGRLGIIRRRKRYYCLKCGKYHGKAALRKWYKHRRFRGEEPKQLLRTGD
jgi:hypothetical protein